MKAIILAGGSGTRLWPLSRKNFPKQFLKINGDRSLLQQTADRVSAGVSAEDIVIMSNAAYKFYVQADLPEIERIILEPASRNTAPAIALAVKYCTEILGAKNEDVLFISPADHVIRPYDEFAERLRTAERIAGEGHIVTFGIRPDRAETGYGYIKCSAASGAGYLKAEKFMEKPDAQTAAKYVESGDYFWNSGMFAFRVDRITGELKKHAPEIAAMLDLSYEEMLLDFHKMPDISIDYAVMEKSDGVVTLPLDLYWNDIGSWDSVYDVLEKDSDGNVKKGDVISIDTRNSLIIGTKRNISAIGLEDCLIVETDDALLVAKKGEAQKVKDVVNRLKRDVRTEADEHVTTYRPWGSYTILEEGLRYKIKRIVVNPGEKLSLQMHYHRSEHWVVVKGTAKVTIGEKEIFVHENESVFVPKSTNHRLENPGKVLLEMIEVQSGEYVGEDDIVRYDDIYKRHL